MKDLFELAEHLNSSNITVRSITEVIDLNTPIEMGLLNMFGTSPS